MGGDPPSSHLLWLINHAPPPTYPMVTNHGYNHLHPLGFLLSLLLAAQMEHLSALPGLTPLGVVAWSGRQAPGVFFLVVCLVGKEEGKPRFTEVSQNWKV